MKLAKRIFISLFVLVIAAGYSKEKEETKKEVTAESKENGSEKEQKRWKVEAEEEETESKEKAEVYAAAETFEEIAFQNVNWFFGSPERQPKGGNWVFIEE